MRILVTGCAGFIGFHVARALAKMGHTVVGVDDVNAYYDPALKWARLAVLGTEERFVFHRLDITDVEAMGSLFAEVAFTHVVHLAAQAGVRHSLTDPFAYVEANVRGHLSILEAARHRGRSIEHLVYASSSSVYAGSRDLPFSEEDRADRPYSLYGASKRATELMSFAYAHLFAVPSTGLRFFSVYGPWGRPDMAAWIFASRLRAGAPIQVFNHGRMERDFTYVDDIVRGVIACLDHPPVARDGEPPHRVLNLGNDTPVPLMTFIATLERALGRTATIEGRPMQPGDTERTHADVSEAARLVGFAPSTPIDVGIPRFVAWFEEWCSGVHRATSPDAADG